MIRPPSPALVGQALIKTFAPFLTTDVSVERIRKMHSTLMESLKTVDSTAMLYTFGSTYVYGISEAKSDVDFVILRESDIKDGKGEDSVSAKENALQTHTLGKFAKQLRQRHIAWGIEEVKRTRVPVVRVKNSVAAFDVTAFRRNGVRNSALLRAYFEQDPSSRWLSLAVKQWSKRTGMNGPLNYLTSYGFNIMVVYYLLQRHRFKFVPHDTTDVAKVDPLPRTLPLTAPEPTQLGSEIIDFFTFYLYEFQMFDHVISLSREGITTRQSLNWTKEAEDMMKLNQEKGVSYRLCIEDPYEVNLNVGRNVSPFKMDMMRKHFERALQTGLGLVIPSK